jgi:metal-sulfur cluster biosynthetic enzyme
MTEEKTSSDQPVWDIESSHPELVDAFKTRMREVVDPELGLDIIALGLLRNVRIDDESGYLYMILTTPFCPYGPAMIEQTRRKAEEALERPVSVELGMDMWDFSMMEEGAMPEWGSW